MTLMAVILSASAVCAQSGQEGAALLQEAAEIMINSQSPADLENALKKVKKGLAIFEKLNSDEGKGYAFGLAGSVYARLWQYTKALENYGQSLQMKKKIGDVKGEADTLDDIGGVYGSLSQYGKAIEYFEQSLQIRKKLGGDSKVEAATLNHIGLAYANLNQYAKALDYYEKSLRISQRVRDTKVEGAALNNIGLAYNSLGKYADALKYYEQALRINRQTADIRGERTTLNNIGAVYRNLGQYNQAIGHYDQSLALSKKAGDVRGECYALNNIGLLYENMGLYTRALENLEQSLKISRKLGDSRAEGTAINNIGMVYEAMGEYAKALEHYDQSLQIKTAIGDLSGEGDTLNNIGWIYMSLGQYDKALKYYEQRLQIAKKLGEVPREGAALENIGHLYTLMGKYTDAEKTLNRALEILQKLDVSTSGTKATLANIYLDTGDLAKAEPLVRSTGNASTRGRLALLKSDYPAAVESYKRDVEVAEDTGNAVSKFQSYTGLAKAYEGMENYRKADEYYQEAMNLSEDLRSSLRPLERCNFFEAKSGGFARSEPAKGLTRVRMKLNRTDGGIESSELTKARAFSDQLAQISSTGASGIPKETSEREKSLVNRLAALKRDLAKTDKQMQFEKYDTLSKEVKVSQTELNAFVETLWKQNPAYAAVKYPRPVPLSQSALRPDEYVVMFDLLGEGVGVKLIHDKKIKKATYVKWDQKDLENDVKKFREPFEKLKFREFNTDLAEALYGKLLLRALDDVPKGVPLIIIPDGILAVLPFEALVTGGKAKWNKGEHGVDYPEGLTFLGDEHPISYYQSITALTLARTNGAKDKPKDKLLVLADPVFDLKDRRAQQSTQTKITEREKKNNLELMETIEGSSDGSFKFKRLAQTEVLADNLQKIYGSNCLSLTGIKANKSDFLSKIAPKIDQYGSVVFATHGVMSTHIPGLMEPFLALSMVPPGTDGFLKMSDILSLRMHADVVALTACQSGLGKELSGEGVMSMGRAFQYAGAKSVLMSLWEVEEKSAVTLAENFFRYRKEGKTKLESLKLARDDIRNAGYKHPFFWSAFILVGEVN